MTPLALTTLLLAVSCSSVGFDDPGRSEGLTIDYTSTELPSLAGEMVESLPAEPQLTYLHNSGKGDDKRVIVYTSSVENCTSEHIDTRGITNEIRTALLSSGNFCFVDDKAGQAQLDEQIRLQTAQVREDMLREL